MQVIKLKGIEIQAPSTYIIEGSEIPLTVWGELKATRATNLAQIVRNVILE